jgi:SAM-dependent methyltransferase
MDATEAQLDRLRAALSELDRKTNDAWIASLSPRKMAELAFHDQDRCAATEDDPYSSDRETANRKYYTTTSASRGYVKDWIQCHSAGLVCLDYACGNGDYALAAAGASLAIGIDLSSTSIRNARARAAYVGVSGNTRFVQADCEATGLPDDSVDRVMCLGVLHHLDLSYAFPEMRRIMRPGGRCLALEALAYNPLIRLYRWLTPQMRTEWEKRHILSLRDVHFAQRFFEVENLRDWHLFSMLATPLRNTRSFVLALGAADAIDRVVLRAPVVRQLAWMFSFELVKRATDRASTA